MSSAFCASLRPVIIFIETIGIEPALLVRHMEVDRPQVLEVESEMIAGVDRHGLGDAAGQHERARRDLPISLPEHVRQERDTRSEEHTSELQSLMRISYAVFCLKKKKKNTHKTNSRSIIN